MEKIKLILLCCFSLFLTNVSATVRLPHLFSDHMVIQRDQPVKIWGWADKSETIEVVFGSQSKKVKADKNGNWALSLDKMAFGGPYSMQIKGRSNHITLKDIYVGDVWLCSGQSNMEMPVHGWSSVDNYQEEIKNGQQPV